MPYPLTNPTLGSIPVNLGSQLRPQPPWDQTVDQATNRTIHDTNGNVFDVLSTPFQTVDNPNGDDFAPVDAAIQAAIALGGGNVLLPYKPGGEPYIFSQPLSDYNQSHITITGHGRATKIQPNFTSDSEALFTFSGEGSGINNVSFSQPYTGPTGPYLDCIALAGRSTTGLQLTELKVHDIFWDNWNGWCLKYISNTGGYYPFGTFIWNLMANTCGYGIWIQGDAVSSTATHMFNTFMSNVELGPAYQFQNSIDHHVYSPSGNCIDSNPADFMHLIGEVRTLDVVNYNGGSKGNSSLSSIADPITGAVPRLIQFFGGAIQESDYCLFLTDFQQMSFTGVNFYGYTDVGAHITAQTTPNALITFSNCTWTSPAPLPEDAVADIVVQTYDSNSPVNVLINGCAFTSGSESGTMPLLISCPATNNVTMMGCNDIQGTYTAVYDNEPTIYEHNNFS